MKITDSAFLVPGIVANPFLILDADGPILRDAGLRCGGKNIQVKLDRLH